MRQFLLALCAVLLLGSCSQDIDTNTPALQAIKDSILFRSVDQRAFIGDNGNLIIQGQSTLETLSFSIGSTGQSVITFGGANNTLNIASFRDADGNVFTTANEEASGRLELIQNLDNTYTGTFNFIAKRNATGREIFMHEGILYRVPFASAEEVVDIDEPDDSEIPEDSFTARVNDASFNAETISSVTSSGNLVISGATTDASITLTFPVSTGPGDYDIMPDSIYTANYILDGVSAVGQSGTLTIITNDTENSFIEGRFNFETNEGFSITDGAFSFSY